MKRILICFFILSLSLAGNAQLHTKDIVTLNELYTDPGSGNNEFIELYNSSLKSVNMDDYTLVLYYSTASSYGFYVLDLPEKIVTRDSFYVLASAATFYAQANTPLTANFDWSSVLNASSGNSFLHKYEYNTVTLKYDSLTVGASEVNNIMVPKSGSGGQYHVLVYDEGNLVNFFVGGDNSLPSYVNTWKSLTVPFRRTGKADSTINFNFSTLQTSNVESVVSNTGTDNGYRRTNDGQCASWVKSSSGAEHTPGRTNGAATNSGSLTASVTLSQSASNVNALNLAYNITGSSDPSVWPITIRVVNDYSPVSDNPITTTIYEPLLPEGSSTPYNDVDVEEVVNTGVAPNGTPDVKYTYPIPLFQAADANTGGRSYLTAPIYTPGLYNGYTGTKVVRAFHVFFTCNSGCIDQVAYAQMTQTPVLPVEFKTFTAKRNDDQVLLNWQTASEHSNTGFAVERNLNGQWTEVAFVPSLAPGGNSDVPLSYQHVDANDHKGISQYRIRQSDLSDKTAYSAVRSVQGEGVNTKLVIYPNPSFDGRVQVVFQETSNLRHLVITDMSGRVVRQFNNVSSSSLSIDGLTPGIYTARVIDQSTGESILQKFVIQQK